MHRTILAVVLLVTGIWAQAPHVAIRNARIVPVSGPSIEKGTVVIRDGLISAVGADVPVPDGAWVIEGDGLTVYPGLIDALSTAGLPTLRRNGGGPSGNASTDRAWGPEDRPGTTSWQKAADLFTPSDRRVRSSRNLGITAAAVYPTNGIAAGQGSLLQLAEETGRSVVLSPSVGQYLTMTPTPSSAGFPSSLMGVIAYIKQLYLDAAHYAKAKEIYAQSPRGRKRPSYDRALEGVLESPRVLLPANRAVHIVRMLHLAKTIQQPAVLYGGHEAYASVDALREANTPVLVNLQWPEAPRDRDPDTQDDIPTLQIRSKAPSSPAALQAAGVPFAFYFGDLSRYDDVVHHLDRARNAGLTQDVLVKSLTLTPAEIYQAADRLGSIEPGKIANLTVTKGDLFGKGSSLQYVFIDGVQYEPEESSRRQQGPRPRGTKPAQQTGAAHE